MPRDPNYLVWIDLETTGTDEQLDRICEIALIVTTPDLTEICCMESVVMLDDRGWQRLRANTFVEEMHRKSGLLAELDRPGIIVLSGVEALFVMALRQLGKPHEFMLAGSGVGHFDRRFLKRWMSGLEQLFQYPVLDVGVVRRMLHLWGRDDLVYPEPKDKEHRAMADISDHLNEARHYHRVMGGVRVGR